MKRATLLVLLAAGTGCLSQRPQVMIPVRVDTVVSASPAAMVVTAPAASVSSAPRVQGRTAADDPIARIDRMDWPGPNASRSSSGEPVRTTGSSGRTTPSPRRSIPRASR